MTQTILGPDVTDVTFSQLNDKIKTQFAKMQHFKLFRSKVTGDQLWDTYISGFLPEENPTFRDPESSTQNCNNDKHFIRRYGNVVAIDMEGKVHTMFDFEIGGQFKHAIPKVQALLSSSPVESLFVESYENLNQLLSYEKVNKTQKEFQLGQKQTLKIYTQEEADKFGVVIPGQVYTFNHFHVYLSKDFVDFSGKSVESLMGDAKAAYDVFKRGMEEYSVETLILVKELIEQNSLLNGASYLGKLNTFIELKKEYNALTNLGTNHDNWLWYTSLGLNIAKFRNELIGVLCSELESGVELKVACKTWNKRADPVNYMKASAPISQSQIKEAQKTIEELGYTESFTSRRFAELSDINVSEIQHKNVDKKQVVAGGLFAGVKPTNSKVAFDLKNVPVVPISEFMELVLPTCTDLQLFLENRFQNNLVALFNGQGKEMFKWNNAFSWTYNGNLAGKSQLTEMVEAKGGRTDGAFRFTHSWNKLTPNQSLMDLHVFMPGVTGRRVGWNQRRDVQSGGTQDVDYTGAAPIGYVPVENITFPELSKMPDGLYVCKIHNWNFRISGGKGEAEIAFDGNVFQYEYPATKNHQWITIAEVTLKNGQFTIDHKIEPVSGFGSTKQLWNLDSNQFHKVNLVCYSPNHWNTNNVGNKHCFFMLEDCKTDVPMRSFHNEYLNGDLLAHRKVMEVLASTTMIQPADKQLAGVGFNTTVTDTVVVKVNNNKLIKIQF